MKRHIISLLLVLALVLSLGGSASAATVQISPQKLSVNGTEVACEKYNIDGNNYFKLRDVAQLMNGTAGQFSVGWDAAANTVSIATGESYVSNGTELVTGQDNSATAVVSSQTIVINGQVRSDIAAYNIGGSNFFKLRDLGSALGLYVDYDAATNTAILNSNDSTPVQTAKWYSEGMYRVGTDIPAGDYYAVQTDPTYSGYYCKYTDSSQEDIEDNDIFSNYTFFRTYDGQYLKLSRCKITDISNAPVPVAVPDDTGCYGEGTYRIGIDIPAGEYYFKQIGDDSGYYCVYSDISRTEIVDNDLFEGNAFYTVKDGQFLKVSRASAILVSNM